MPISLSSRNPGRDMPAPGFGPFWTCEHRTSRRTSVGKRLVCDAFTHIFCQIRIVVPGIARNRSSSQYCATLALVMPFRESWEGNEIAYAELRFKVIPCSKQILSDPILDMHARGAVNCHHGGIDQTGNIILGNLGVLRIPSNDNAFLINIREPLNKGVEYGILRRKEDKGEGGRR